MARGGATVGLLDADVYGYSIPRMMGVSRPAAGRGWRLFALEFDRTRESPLLARAPATP